MTRYLSPLTQRRTYLETFDLVFDLVIGVLWFSVFTTLIATGASLLITLVGPSDPDRHLLPRPRSGARRAAARTHLPRRGHRVPCPQAAEEQRTLAPRRRALRGPHHLEGALLPLARPAGPVRRQLHRRHHRLGDSALGDHDPHLRHLRASGALERRGDQHLERDHPDRHRRTRRPADRPARHPRVRQGRRRHRTLGPQPEQDEGARGADRLAP